MSGTMKHLAALGLLINLVAACAITSFEIPFMAEGPVWPAAPELARVQFVGEFSEPRDLGIGLSFWEKVATLTAGSVDRRMVRPMAVAVTSDSRVLFVADPDSQCVHRYDLNTRRYRCLGLAGQDDAVYPIGLAVIDDQWLVVTDSQQGRIYKADLDSDELEVFYVAANLDQPTGVFWNPRSERLFVTDTGGQCIFEFDRAGNLKRRIGGHGAGPGKFNFPTYIWVDRQNELLVTDSLNFRLQRFDGDGEFITEFGEIGDRPGDFSRPKGVAADQLGHIYSIDALMHSMQVFNKKGELLLTIGGQGQGQGQFWLPNGIFVTPDNTIFVADSYNRRVQVFRYVGPET